MITIDCFFNLSEADAIIALASCNNLELIFQDDISESCIENVVRDYFSSIILVQGEPHSS